MDMRQMRIAIQWMASELISMNGQTLYAPEIQSVIRWANDGAMDTEPDSDITAFLVQEEQKQQRASRKAARLLLKST